MLLFIDDCMIRRFMMIMIEIMMIMVVVVMITFVMVVTISGVAMMVWWY